MIYLLDTDIFIFLLRGSALEEPRNARQRSVKNSAAKFQARCKKRLGDGDSVGLSAISLAELEFGVCHGREPNHNRDALRRTLTPFEAWSFEPVDCVRRYGIIRSALESGGRGIGPLDTLIAAHAVALGAVLVTHNLSEFQRVPGLRVEDWA